MANYGLTEQAIATIHAVLSRYEEVETAIIYGSRVKGNYRAGSDIDLCLKGDAINDNLLSRIAVDLENSDSPYFFDLSAYHQLTYPPLIQNIDQMGQLFYQRIK